MQTYIHKYHCVCSYMCEVRPCTIEMLVCRCVCVCVCVWVGTELVVSLSAIKIEGDSDDVVDVDVESFSFRFVLFIFALKIFVGFVVGATKLQMRAHTALLALFVRCLHHLRESSQHNTNTTCVSSSKFVFVSFVWTNFDVVLVWEIIYNVIVFYIL